MIRIFLFILFLTFPSFIQATEASSSAEDVQSIREVVQQKVNEKLNIITTPSTKAKSFFGSITQINDQKIDINQNNENKTIITDNETTFINLKRSKITLSDIKPGDEILAMGYINSKNQLEAKRVIITNLDTVKNDTQVINGQVVDISQTSLVFVIVPNDNKNSQYQIETTSTNLKKITTGQKIIAIIKPDEKIDNTFNLLKIISPTSISATPTP